MRKRCTVIILALASTISASAVAGAQTSERPTRSSCSQSCHQLLSHCSRQTLLTRRSPSNRQGRRQRLVTPGSKPWRRTSSRISSTFRRRRTCSGPAAAADSRSPRTPSMTTSTKHSSAVTPLKNLQARRSAGIAGYAPRQCVRRLRRWTHQRPAESVAPWHGPD